MMDKHTNYISITLVDRMMDKQYFRMISSSVNEAKNPPPGRLLKQPGPSEFSTGQHHKLWLINGFNGGHRHVIKETDSLSRQGLSCPQSPAC